MPTDQELPIRIVIYKEFRAEIGKSAILVWQKMCNLFGFDPDPTVTVAFKVIPVIEDPSLMAADKVGGPAGGPKRLPFDPPKQDELREKTEYTIGVDPAVPGGDTAVGPKAPGPDSAAVVPDDGVVKLAASEKAVIIDGGESTKQPITLGLDVDGDGKVDQVVTIERPVVAGSVDNEELV